MIGRDRGGCAYSIRRVVFIARARSAAWRSYAPRAQCFTSQLTRARGLRLDRAGRSRGYQRLARTVVSAGVRRTVRRAFNRSVEIGELRYPAIVDYVRSAQESFVERFENMTDLESPAWTTSRSEK